MSQERPRLLTVEEAEALSVTELWRLYRDFVNPGQQAMIASFCFGRERVVRAEGCRIETDSGRRVLDFTGGMGVLNHGHNHPRILAVRQHYQEQRRMEVHKNYLSPHLAALSHNIARLLPGDLDISYFPNSGAEAVEGALKLAYKAHGGRRGSVLHSDISYHGKLLGAGSVSASRELHFRFPEIPGCHAFRYNDLASVEQLVAGLRRDDGESDIWALIVEPFSASTLRRCDESFLRGVREICNREDIALIFDEVFSGWGKTGTLFHFMRHEGLIPDLLVMSKSLGGGKASIAGFTSRTPWFRRAYGSLGDALLHSTTYNGFGEECATALEAVNVVVEERLVERAQELEQWLEVGLGRLQQRHPDQIAAVRGCGALWGLKLRAGESLPARLAGKVPLGLLRDPAFMDKLVAAAVINELYRRENLLIYHVENGEVLLVLSPPLVAGRAEVEEALAALDRVLAEGVLALCLKFVASSLFSRFLELRG